MNRMCDWDCVILKMIKMNAFIDEPVVDEVGSNVQCSSYALQVMSDADASRLQRREKEREWCNVGSICRQLYDGFNPALSLAQPIPCPNALLIRNKTRQGAAGAKALDEVAGIQTGMPTNGESGARE